jgi:vitamin B12 transporter
MRTLRAAVSAVLLVTSAFAADLKLKVVDPLSVALSGAQVSLIPASQSTPLKVLITSGDGSIAASNLPDGAYRVEILVPGFAPYKADLTLPRDANFSATLSIAAVTETVVVSATRSLLPVDLSGASVSTLENGQLLNMQPVALNDSIRFLPGAVISTAGQRGGLASLFVRGGESTYNKVIIDGVPVNEPGGTFDLGTVPLQSVDRLELLRGAQSTLYGSDAMTSVLQLYSRTGSSETPEILFGADGGNLWTAHGYGSVSGTHGRFDYNVYADQFNTEGQGINDDYSNSLQGANLGARLTDYAFLRVRVRHSNSRTGLQGEWEFNGNRLFPPDADQRARQNNLLASAELTIAGPLHWQHRFEGYEYDHRRLDADTVADRGCDPANFNFFDCYFQDLTHTNTAGFNYQADYTPRSWLQTTLGYEFEDENGNFNTTFVNTDPNGNFGQDFTHGLRRNHALFFQQRVTRGRASLVAGFRYVHNESFGDRVVPRVAATYLLLRGGQTFSGTRFRFAYAQGIKEPSFEQSFGITGTFPALPNPNLKAEENRSYEAGFEQAFFAGRYALSALYFNNQFRNQIEFFFDPVSFDSFFLNLNRSMAHGAEVELKGAVTSHLQFDGAYTYDSTQILDAPGASPPNAAGEPLLRRPKHSGSLLLNYLGTRWGGNLGGSFVGRRPDSDFLGLNPPVTHAAGYALVNLGGWYAVRPRITLYANIENALNRHYEEVVGYPALHLNFRAGLRFRLGGG